MESGITCETFKESKAWLRSESIRPQYGPGDTWPGYCISTFFEIFKANADEFPCLNTCGFCKGAHIETPKYGKYILHTMFQYMYIM